MQSNLKCWGTPLLLAVLCLLTAVPQRALAQDEPNIIKDSIRFEPFTSTCGSCPDYVLRWWPQISFRVNGPIAAGSQLHVEVFAPGTKKPWKTFDCDTSATAAGYWWKVKECGGANIAQDKGVFYTGLIEFKIGMRNEVLGTDTTLFTGKAKVGKTTPPFAAAAGSFMYYTDFDWHIPIGLIYLAAGNGVPDFFPPRFFMEIWLRAKDVNPNAFHLFYQGKEVAKEKGCSADTYGVDDSRVKQNWSLVTCEFHAVYRESPDPQHIGEDAGVHDLSKSPGQYEIKMIYKGELARSIKFTVAAGGSFDNGIGAANKMGEDATFVPVKVVGNQEGVWDRLAWKTGAFYGNPLTGFTAPP